ncbi:hypothetical protein BBJ28_00024015 [Nothophytophthora sp. Chile5]|nr:hypothetical protein BBJ28_00024015 [Nothophytophthora sp. Chile5]
MLAAIVVSLNGSFANKVSKIDGWIELYSRIYYGDRYLKINFRYPNKCYNMACTGLDDKLASARWSGLPTTGLAGKAYIAFYEDEDCEGYASHYELPHFGGIRDFDVQRVKGKISAFKVLSEPAIIDNGIGEVCMWTGALTEDGSVSEDNSISLVNSTMF